MPATLVSQGSTWNYSATGIDLPANWVTAGYNDAAWPSGPAKLGYGDGDEATVIGYGPDPNNKYVTTFFRHTFQVTSAASYSNLKVGLRRDDGGIVYFNGTEIFRSNMPEGPIGFSTFASAVVGGADETTFYEHPVDPSLLVDGANILAVRIHQVGGNSSDLSFDLYLTGTAFPLNAAPTVNAGPDQTIAPAELALLEGQVADDGLPIPPGLLTIAWTKIAGPGTVAFANAGAARTTATFASAGSYTLRLTANDGTLARSDDVVILVSGDAYQDWKASHFTAAELLDPAISGDTADPDQDDHNNYQEFLADTNPRDPESVLKIVELYPIPADPATLEIRFNAVAGRSYSIQSRAVSAGDPWTALTNLPTQSTTGVVTVTLTGAVNATPRFYRVVTP